MIDLFFFHQCWFFCSVSSWKISSCFKPVQFWSNSSLVVDKTTMFHWLCVLSLLLLPPLHIMYFILLKTSQLFFALWLGDFFFPLAFSFLFNNTNLFCNSFSHSNALWLAHNTMAGMRSHKTNTHTEPTRHVQDLYLLLTDLFYPGLSFTTL